jgi:quinol monooxygenase YgiN
MIHVIATIQVVRGRRKDFLSQFRKVEPVVRQETGCLEYAPAVDLNTEIPAQAPVRDDVVTVVEKWEDTAALNAHLAAPHMAEYRESVKDIIVSVDLRVLEPA